MIPRCCMDGMHNDNGLERLIAQSALWDRAARSRTLTADASTEDGCAEVSTEMDLGWVLDPRSVRAGLIPAARRPVARADGP